MRIGVISDTHGAVENTQRAVRMLESLEVEAVLHCGDIGTPDVVGLLAAWQADYDHAPLAQAIAKNGQTFCGEFGEVELGGAKIAIAHGHDAYRLHAAIDSGAYALVCTGHTHKQRLETVGETLVLNPGALYRANPHTIAVVELPSLEATHVAV